MLAGPLMFADILRAVIVAETSFLLVAYLWALQGLLRRLRAEDGALRVLRIGRICRVAAIALTLGLEVLALAPRFGHPILSWALVPFQLSLLGFGAAWALLDRTHYRAARGNGEAKAAGRVLLKMADIEPPENE